MRARNLKPGLFKNEILGAADPICTLVFQGLWMLADRDGRLEDRPVRIKGELFPYRDVDCDDVLAWLASNRFITRYTMDGQKFIEIINFAKHQNPHRREVPSVIPGPEQGKTKARKRTGRSTTKDSPRTGLGTSKDSPGSEPARLTPHSLTPDSPFSDSPSQSLTASPAAQASVVDEVDLVFDHWKTVWGHPRAKLDKDRRKLIGKRLADYPADSLCQAISGYQHSPHHTGQNDRTTVYDDIGLFLRDSAHVDAGLRFANQPLRTDQSALMRKNVAAIADWTPPEVRRAAN